MDRASRGIPACAVVAIGTLAACGPSPSPPSPPTTVTVAPRVAEPPPTQPACEVVAAVLGPDDEPTIERRTAAGCLEAYEAFGGASGAVVWVRRIGGVANDSQLTEIWDVPPSPGDVTCAISIGIESGRVTGHAEGTSSEGLQLRAQQDACSKIGLDDATCRERANARSTRMKMRFVDGQRHAEATVEYSMIELAGGEGTGETKLDACRAAIREACRDGACGDAAITARRIDDIPLGRPSGWPRHPGLFGEPRPKPP